MFEISKSTLKIQEFLEEKEPGTFIKFSEIQSETQIPMNNKGKGYLRTALNRMKTEYIPVRSIGIILASPDNSMAIVNGKIIRIDNATKRANKTHKRIVNDFYEKLSENDKKRADFVGAVLAIIRQDASGIKKLISGRKPLPLSNYDKPIL